MVEAVLGMLPSVLESGETEQMTAVIDSVVDMDGCSIMVAASDGTAFEGSLDTVEDSDAVAALHIDLMQNTGNAMSANGLGRLESLVLCSDEATMKFYTSAEDFTVISHQNEAEIDSIAVKPSKSAPARLKRALQGLVSLPGVSKSMVLTAEGETVLSIGFEDAGDLASGLADMINDVIKSFCEDTKFGNLHACVINTDKAIYQIMCLGSKHYLVSELGTKVPEFVWRRDIPAEASFVLASV